jgi:hypothetical protein
MYQIFSTRLVISFNYYLSLLIETIYEIFLSPERSDKLVELESINHKSVTSILV